MGSNFQYESSELNDNNDRLELEYINYSDALNREEQDFSSEASESDNKGKASNIFSGLKKAFSEDFGSKLIITIYVLTCIRIVADIVMFFRGVIEVNYKCVPHMFIYYMFAMLIPYATWVFSTRQKYARFSYRLIRMTGLMIGVVSMCSVILNILFLGCCMFAVPLILKIPVSADISANMIINLARLSILIPPVIVALMVLKSSIDIIFTRETIAMIDDFMVDRNIDDRKERKVAYDYVSAKDKRTGMTYHVSENTRKTHMLVMGPTGAGKTSMAFTTAIANDLDKRTQNEGKLKKSVQHMLESGKIVLTKDIRDAEFDLKYFRPLTDNAKKELMDIEKKYPMCGITVVAPNASFGDDVFDLCKARGIKKLYRVDPLLDDSGNHKEGFIGFNPYYINPDLSEFDKRIELVNKARIFADVLQMIYEAGGSVDTYFSGLNKQLTSCLSTIIMKAYPILHEKYPDKYRREQACPQEFLDVMNDFDLAKDYVAVMEDYMRSHPDERRDYENKIKLIQRDLLGDGAKTMREQARGLVNIISDILANPLIGDVLCAEKTMDLDKALSENYVTIINYELSLGDSDSRAFGDFFLLLFQTAVFRRPKNHRPFHMLYVDEFPVILHPSMEKMFSLYRQYGVCCAVAIQSLSQFDKSESTKFMKQVVLNNARTHIVFGGLGPEEMEYYEKLFGKDFAVTVQNSISETALSLEETQQTQQTRTSVAKEEVFTGRELRDKAFQEATMITIEKGNTKDAFPIRFDFLTDEQKKGIKTYKVDWNKYYNEESADGTETIHKKRDVLSPDPDGIVRKVQTNMAAMVNMSSGYQMKDERILNSVVSGIDVNKEAVVISSELTTRDRIERIRNNIEKNSNPDSVAEKKADISVNTEKKLENERKNEVIGKGVILEGLDFMIGDYEEMQPDDTSEPNSEYDSDDSNENDQDSSVEFDIDSVNFDKLIK